MKSKLLSAAFGLLLCSCMSSSFDPLQHEGTDNFPPANKELREVKRTFVRHEFDPEIISQAVKDKKIVALYFSSPWCKWCMKMDQKVWSHPEIADVIDKAYSFVDISLDSDDGKELFIKYTNMFELDKAIPLTVLLFPRIGKDEKPIKDFVIPSADISEIDQLFASTLFLTAEGYVEPYGLYRDLYRLGIVYNKILKKMEPTSSVVDAKDPFCIGNIK